MDFKEALDFAFENGELPEEELEERVSDSVDEIDDQPEDHAISDAIPEDVAPDLPEGQAADLPGELEVETETLNDLNQYFRSAVGRDITFEEAQQMLDAQAWQSALTQDEVDRITAALQAPAPEAPASPDVAVPAALDLSGFDLLEDDQARLAATLGTYIDNAVNPLREQVTESQASIDQYRQQEYEASNARMESQILTGLEDFKSAHPELTPDEIAGMQTRLQQSGNFTTFLQVNDNDGRAAINAALETTMFADPDMRAKVIASEMQAERAAQDEDETRKQDIASLGGSNNSGSPTLAPTDTEPETLQDALSRALKA